MLFISLSQAGETVVSMVTENIQASVAVTRYRLRRVPEFLDHKRPTPVLLLINAFDQRGKF